MNASCEHFAEYVARSLDANAARAFEAHVASCPGCAAELKRERELERLLTLAKARPVPVPPALQEWLEAKLESAAARRAWRARIVRYAPLAAAATILLAMTAFWSVRDLPRTKSLTDQAVPAQSASPHAARRPEQALAALALFAVERRVSGQRVPTWLAGPDFPEVHISVKLGTASTQKRENEAQPTEPVDDGPKRGTLERFDAISVESFHTLGERKLDQALIRLVRNKENIPC